MPLIFLEGGQTCTFKFADTGKSTGRGTLGFLVSQQHDELHFFVLLLSRKKEKEKPMKSWNDSL